MIFDGALKKNFRTMTVRYQGHHRPKVVVLTWFMMSCCMLQAIATAPQRLTLRHAIELGLRFNPGLKQAHLNRVLQQSALHVAEDDFAWQASLNGKVDYFDTRRLSEQDGFEYRRGRQGRLVPQLKRHTTQGTDYTLRFDQAYDGSTYRPQLVASVAQPLGRGADRIINRLPLTLAHRQVALDQLALQQAKIETVSQVILHYIDYIETLQFLAINRETLNNYRQFEKIIRARIRAGDIPESELNQSQADIAQQTLAVLLAESRVMQSRAALLEVIGLPMSLAIEVQQQLSITASLPQQAMAVMQQALLRHDLGYQRGRLRLYVDEVQYAKARDDRRWQVDVSADMALGADSGTYVTHPLNNLLSGKNRDMHLNLTVGLPLTTTRLEHSLLEAKTHLAQDQLHLEVQRRHLLLALSESLRRLDLQQRQIKLSKQALYLARKSLTAVRKQQRYGRASAFSVSYAQQQVRHRQENLNGQTFDYMRKVTMLQAKLGMLLEVWGLAAS